MEHQITTHNGYVTIENPETGSHATFRINTGQSGDWEGTRFVGLLTGSDNEGDYRSFGNITDDGTIRVWKNFTGNGELSKFDKFALYLERPEYYAERLGLVFQFAIRCRVCNRVLTTPQSITSGIGPTCAKNVGISQAEYYTDDSQDTDRADKASTELCRTRALENQEQQHNRGRDQKIYRASKRKLRKLLDTFDKLYDSKRILANNWLDFTFTVPVEHDDYQPFDDALTAFEDWFKYYLKDDYGYFIEPDMATFLYGYVAIGIRHDADKGLLFFSGSWTE